jgi:hypothetical protein
LSTPAPARPHPAGLPAFTAALTSHLPGAWRTTFRYLLLPPGHDALDLLQAAVQRDETAADLVPHQATVLTGPGAERFLITDHPLWHETYLVRALIPDGILLGHDLLDDGTTALTMDLPGDPTAAAASLTSDFLPRYDAAAEPLRLRLLAAHLHAARALDEAWEAVAAAYFDDRGRPVADAEYHQAKALIRDEPGWTHFEAFLTHGPALLASAHAAARTLDPVEDSDWQRRLATLATSLRDGQELWRIWLGERAFLTDPDGRIPDQRRYTACIREYADAGWRYVGTWLADGPVLLEIARAAAEPQTANAPRRTARAEAAQARSTTEPALTRAGTPQGTPPDRPAPSAPPPLRTR